MDAAHVVWACMGSMESAWRFTLALATLSVGCVDAPAKQDSPIGPWHAADCEPGLPSVLDRMPPTMDLDPVARVTSTHGDFGLRIVDAQPAQPTKYGTNSWFVELTDTNDDTIEGASLQADARVLYHGVSSGPIEASPMGDGRYQFDFEFIMYGWWNVEITIREGDVEDRVEYDICVPRSTATP